MDYIKFFESSFDCDWFREHLLKLYEIERKQTFPAYQKSAKYIHNLLLSEGFDSKYIEFPADGKTTYQDKCMPIGWDVSTMRLTVLTPIPGLKDPVVADYEREPLHAVKHSVSTPPEGIEVRIITETQMKMGADVKGALILLDHRTQPRLAPIRMLLDLGAIGWISDYSENPNQSADTVFWGNSETEYGLWHIHSDERRFIAFQVTERAGTLLRQACNNGTVKAHVLSDAKRYETVFPAVTSLLPGEDSREVWIVAHTCEPLIDDNSNGVLASIAILKALRSLTAAGKLNLKYSVRVVFASELYGMSAVCEYFGGDLSKLTIGGINVDAFVSSTDKSCSHSLRSREGSDLPGFAGNLFLRALDEKFLMHHPEMSIVKQDHSMGDDTFFNDRSIGMPVVWILNNAHGYHHNSIQTPAILDTSSAVPNFAFSAEWVRMMAALTSEELTDFLPMLVEKAIISFESALSQPIRPGTDVQARTQYLLEREICKLRMLSLWGDPQVIENAIAGINWPVCETEKTHSDGTDVWYQYADNFIFKRMMRGFPHDLIRIPKEKRTLGYGGMLYSTFSEAYSRMDGVKTLQDVIREAEWDTGIIYSEQEIKRWLFHCIMFAEYGYLELEAKKPITEDQIVSALHGLGVKLGETLLVHSGLTGIGYVQGGSETVIQALKKSVGDEGTFLAPAFTFPYLMFDGDINKGYQFRPYDTRVKGTLRDKTVRTGSLPKAMLQKSESFRSGHATHEWVAIGKNAEACVAGHGLLESATGDTSPLKKALDANGSVIFLGCAPGANTFLHFVEMRAKASYTEAACIQYIDQNGERRTAMAEDELFGCRNFYYGIDSAYYKEAMRRGLHVYEQSLGVGTIYRMELRELYDITMQMLREDPYVLLCKEETCPFCARFIPEHRMKYQAQEFILNE